MKRWVKRLGPICGLVVFVLLIGQRWGDLPALGPLLHPYSGVWQAPSRLKLGDRDFQVSGTRERIDILWDEHRVPHIFAKDRVDLAFAQGFIHASQRLFQMDLQARAGGARLSELVGTRALDMDKFYVSIGFRRAREKIWREMAADPQSKADAEAYASGVNAWIEGLADQDLPFEYRLLNARPERFRPENIAELLVVMSYRLTARSFDLALTTLAQKYGMASVRQLFPEFMPSQWEAPIYGKWLDPRAGDLPEPSAKDFLAELVILPERYRPFANNGSNNWAVGPSRSATGRSLLANDTHLGLSLPGMWFEQHLISPEQNVYGGAFAGAPGVLSGFTAQAAWAVTNGTTDVVDWYQLRFRDEQSLEYESPRGWLATRELEELIKVRGGESVTLKYIESDLGPVIQRSGQLGLAMRWTVHDGSDILRVFRGLNLARSEADCRQSVNDLRFPIQNTICADVENISITHAGTVPRRWRGQGRFVLDGGREDHRWGDFIPAAAWPRKINPREGFVASANQRPVAADSVGTYGAEAESSYRGAYLARRLSEDRKWNLEDFIGLQTDVVNPLARNVVPKLVTVLQGVTGLEAEARASLASWDFRDRRDSAPSAIFRYFWRELATGIWEDQLGAHRELAWPRDERLDWLIQRTAAGDTSDSVWIDDVRTEAKESLYDVARAAFSRAIQRLSAERGPSLTAWTLAETRRLELNHVGRIPGLSRQAAAPGSKHSLNAMQTNHGPVWRMVVALGEVPEAWTSVLGSSAGDPMSPDYDSSVEMWAAGLYKQVYFLRWPYAEKLRRPGWISWRIEAKR